MMNRLIPHNQPWLDRSEVEAVRRVILRRWVAPGSEADALEREMCSRLGEGFHGSAVNSGSAALHLALKAWDIGHGDEVVVPTCVCSAVLNVIFYVGAKPVLVDVRDDDFNVDPAAVSKVLRRRVKAVIVPHLYGFPAPIQEIARFGTPVIEDCAQAIGADIGGRPVGTFGGISVFSFFATKMVTTGHGGMLVSRSGRPVRVARDLRDYDRRPTYKVRYNYGLSDVAASMGRVQLRKLSRMIRLRRKRARLFALAVKGGRISPPQVSGGTAPVFFRFVLRIPPGTAGKLERLFHARGISTVVPMRRHELLHRYLGLSPRRFPAAERMARTTLSIPIFPGLSDAQAVRIAATLRWLSRSGR